MLEFEDAGTPSLSSLPGPPYPGVVVQDNVLYLSQIKLFDI